MSNYERSAQAVASAATVAQDVMSEMNLQLLASSPAGYPRGVLCWSLAVVIASVASSSNTSSRSSHHTYPGAHRACRAW